ncbi:MAG TPA: hypothetical protein VJN68_14140, partial [Burkholderiaceae bacterium]|nr:hypothetical protein [Burkholderiaceae bacterium]
MKFAPRLLLTAVGALATMVAPPSFADDSEVFTSSSFTVGSGVRPNVLFIIDTSGSMDSDVLLYDPTVTYTGTCDSAAIYWVQTTSTDSTPPAGTCTATKKINATANRCAALYAGMQQDGWYHGRFQQLVDDGSYWQDLVNSKPDNKIECAADMGVHGDLDPSIVDTGSNLYARNGSGTNRWGRSTSAGQIVWASRSGSKPQYSMYSGNYVNWINQTVASGRTKTRLQIVQEVASKTIDGLSGVNLGLMRYSRDADGGMVTYPVSELTTASKTAMKALINGYTAAGNTPLSETFFEAYHYLHGDNVDYGLDSTDNSGLFPSVAGSRVNADINSKKYDSPMDYSCQKTFIVYLTDGLPTSDTDANSDIQNLLDNEVDDKGNKVGAKCDDKGPDGTDNGKCMVQLSGYMNRGDLR